MLPVAHAASAGPKFLPVLLAVGGATVAGSYVRAQSRSFGSFAQPNNAVQSEPVRRRLFENCAPEARSPYFDLVLESIFA